ncbi:hypothetical protein FACS1894139_05560 [Planctomycetales bacterium]|nr:hypothetical protein FACS1894107_11470 [Planctomycetales bacterium]GHT04047.1 hypothetical protein FACS1894139_05560 [Planctomycetales bacterium]
MNSLRWLSLAALAAALTLPAVAAETLDDIAEREIERAQLLSAERDLRAAEYVRLGNEFLQARQYRAAAEQFMLALGVDPNSTAARDGRREALRYLEVQSGAENGSADRLVTQAKVREEYNLAEINQFLTKARDAYQNATAEVATVNAKQQALVLSDRLRALDDAEAFAHRAGLRLQGVASDAQVIAWREEIVALRGNVKQIRQQYAAALTELQRAQAAADVKAEKTQINQVAAARHAAMLAQAQDYAQRLDYPPALEILDELLAENPGDDEARELREKIRGEKIAHRFNTVEDLRRDRRVAMLQKLDEDAIANVSAGSPIRYPKDWNALIAKKNVKRKISANDDLAVPKKETLRKLEESYVGFEFSDAPLVEVVLDNIRARTGLNINAAAIPEEIAEKEINLTPHEMRLSNIIKHVLRQVNSANENDDTNIVYTVNDQGIINFLPRSLLKKDEAVATKVYDINDLVVAASDAKRMPTSLAASKKEAYKDADGGGESTPIDDIVRQTLPLDFEESINPGGVKYDDGAKKLIVKGTAEQQARVAELLGRLREIQTTQVSVSAHYLQINDDFWEQFKSDFYNFAENGSALTNSILSPFDNGSNLPDSYNRSHNANDNVRASLYNGDITGFTNVFGVGNTNLNDRGLRMGFQERGILGDLQANWFLQMVRQSERNDELFAPHLVVFNNRYGWIRFLTQIPFINTWEADDSGNDSGAMKPVFSTFDQGCSLEVEPNISPDRKYVTVRLSPQIKKLQDLPQASIRRERVSGGSGATTPGADYPVDLPVVMKFSTGTYATVPDGGSIVISGLSSNVDGEGRQGTPVLMDLPIIGNAFSNRFYQKNKMSYTCLVSAKIIILSDEEAAQTGQN